MAKARMNLPREECLRSFLNDSASGLFEVCFSVWLKFLSVFSMFSTSAMKASSFCWAKSSRAFLVASFFSSRGVSGGTSASGWTVIGSAAGRGAVDAGVGESMAAGVAGTLMTIASWRSMIWLDGADWTIERRGSSGRVCSDGVASVGVAVSAGVVTSSDVATLFGVDTSSDASVISILVGTGAASSVSVSSISMTLIWRAVGSEAGKLSASTVIVGRLTYLRFKVSDFCRVEWVALL